MIANKGNRGRNKLLLLRTAAIVGIIVPALIIAIGYVFFPFDARQFPNNKETLRNIPYEIPVPEEIAEPLSQSVPASELEPEKAPLNHLAKIEELRNEYSNNEIIGFLEIVGTNIEYPVAQSVDNYHYLHHNLYCEEDLYGSIFMDFENNPTELDDNTVIYGHNMRDGSMFHNLRYYLNEDFYKEHKYISLSTLVKETKWEVFAFCHTTTDFYYIQTTFRDANTFYGHLRRLMLESEYETGVNVDREDKIITLSTCSDNNGKYRYVLCAKLLTEQ